MKNLTLRLSILFFILLCYQANAQSINTIEIVELAEGWKDWHFADYTNSQQANFVAVDTAGNIYYTTATRIIKINAKSGVHTVIAGQTDAGYGGDSGPASNSKLDNPLGLVIDKNNNIIFVDEKNFRIRKIDQTTGIIKTIGGSGVNGYSGDGALATNAQIGYARGIALDTAGNILFTDMYTSRIRKIDIKTGIISTFAGSYHGPASATPVPANEATFYVPYDIKINKKNDVFVLDLYNNRIRKIDGQTNMVSIFAGSDNTEYADGAALLDAALVGMTSICFDDSENLYLINLFSSIKKINKSDNRIYLVAGVMDISGFNGDDHPLKETLINGLSLAYNTKLNRMILNDQGNNRLREISFTQTAPIAKRDINFCLKGPSRPLTAAGTNLKWYTQAIGGEYSLIAPSINTDILDTFVYFVSQTIGGDESPRASIVSRVYATDTAKVWDRNAEVCNGADMISVYQNIWIDKYPIYYYLFRDRNLLDSIPDSSPPQKLNTGKQKFFFIIQNEFGCVSPIDSIELFVKDKIPLPEFKTPVNLCQWGPVFIPQAKGTNLQWFTDTTVGGVDTPIILHTGAIGTRYFYLNQTDSNYCTSFFGIMQVNVNPKPKELVKVTSPLTYCQSTIADTFIASGSNLAWYAEDSGFLGRKTPRPSTEFAGKTKTLVCVLNEFGCKGNYAVITTIVNPKPTIESAIDVNTPRTGFPINLTASSDIGHKYLWNTSEKTKNITYLATEKGKLDFWVVAESGDGCRSDTSYHEVYVDADYYWNGKIEIYPNPFNDYIKVTGLNLSDIRSINLFTADGRLIVQSEIPAQSFVLRIPQNLPSGPYIVEINTVGMANPSKLIYKQ